MYDCTWETADQTGIFWLVLGWLSMTSYNVSMSLQTGTVSGTSDVNHVNSASTCDASIGHDSDIACDFGVGVPWQAAIAAAVRVSESLT